MLGTLTFGMTVAGGPPNQLAYLFGNLGAPAAAPFSVGGGCLVWLDLPGAYLLITLGISPVGPLTLDGAGSGSVPFPLPNDGALANLQLTFQGFITDPGISRGFVLTNAPSLVLGY